MLALLKGGASVFVAKTNDGNLPIHVAAGQNKVEIVQTLMATYIEFVADRLLTALGWENYSKVIRPFKGL